MEEIEKVLIDNIPEELKALFSFDTEPDHIIILKFNLWARHLQGKYFSSEDADFHKEIDEVNLKCYRGTVKSFTDIAFRGAAKTARTKLFIAFCVLNDMKHSRKYIKVLSEDNENSTQIVTDIYNIFISPEVQRIYSEIFAKTKYKREERMSSFTTSTGIKLTADIVGTGQRGKLQEEARPDLIWFEDFENKKTLLSAVITQKIWLNMEEARTGLAVNGACIYTCNYTSEAGNVHKLVLKADGVLDILLKIPIITDPIFKTSIDNKNHIVGGKIAWNRYTFADVDYMFQTDEDFEGERLCAPEASKDIYFNRKNLDKMEVLQPKKDIGGFKIYKDYNASHRYAGGHDVAGGVGLDSSASVFIDFTTIPAQVVGTYFSNTILPEAFGDEVYSQGNRFGGALLAIENNKYDQAILKAKQLGAMLHASSPKVTKIGFSKPATWGWNTNSHTKSNMFSDLREAVDSGLLALNDPDLIQEGKGYTRNDLIDNPPDERLIQPTRHFDLLTACAIAWQMRNIARAKKVAQKYPGLNETEEKNPAI